MCVVIGREDGGDGLCRFMRRALVAPGLQGAPRAAPFFGKDPHEGWSHLGGARCRDERTDRCAVYPVSELCKHSHTASRRKLVVVRMRRTVGCGRATVAHVRRR